MPSRRSNRRSSRRSMQKGGQIFNDPTLNEVVKLGIAGMVAMYVATILVNIKAVGTIASSLSQILGISRAAIMSATKGVGVAGVAVKLHKELSKNKNMKN